MTRLVVIGSPSGSFGVLRGVWGFGCFRASRGPFGGHLRTLCATLWGPMGAFRCNFWRTGVIAKSLFLFQDAPWGESWGKPVDGQDGRRQGEWRLRRPKRTRNNTRRNRRENEYPRSKPKQFQGLTLAIHWAEILVLP